MTTKRSSISVSASVSVSSLLDAPRDAEVCVVLAHGAGAGMQHVFLERFAAELAVRRAACFRFQFPSMERGSKRPDRPELCHATIRAAVRDATRVTGLPLIAAGKSFGGRMISQAQALEPLADVRGIAFLGFPLHPPGRPSDERATHLRDVGIPMLFLQGSRDEFALPEKMTPVIERLGKHATAIQVADADHAFHVPARSGKKDETIVGELATELMSWIARLALIP